MVTAVCYYGNRCSSQVIPYCLVEPVVAGVELCALPGARGHWFDLCRLQFDL